jgi:hypothetical protein
MEGAPMNVMPDIANATANAVPVEKLDVEIRPSSMCDNCGQPFEPRSGSGGKPQRFCSTGCRQAHHADKANVANVGQRGEAQTTLPVVVPQPEPESALAEPVEDFSWRDDDSVVLPQQEATAVYVNRDNDLVIRQQRWPEDDVFIYIQNANVMTFIDKLCDVAGIPSVGKP